MPLLAALIGKLSAGLVALFEIFFGTRMALKLAAYTTWGTVMAAFLTSVFVCISSLLTGFLGLFSATGGVNGGMVSSLAMGVGVFIPANAGGVLGCVASVWMATSVYKIQKQGIFNFGA